MDEKTKKEIKTQIEYYLSDSNLECDEFFHNLIYDKFRSNFYKYYS